MSSIPKAVLYYGTNSTWSAAVLLALQEKGYGSDEIDMRVVDTDKGEHFSPTFLRLNSNGTTPALVVPLQKTLSPDVDTRYKSLTDSKSIIDFLDSSRSTQSQTNTTSSAPAPRLTPATISFSAKAATIIDAVHADEGDLRQLWLLNARDVMALRRLAGRLLVPTRSRLDALAENLAQAESEIIRASEKTKGLWRARREGLEWVYDVYASAEINDDELDTEAKEKRERFFAKAKEAWEVKVKDVLGRVNGEMIGPFVLGDQLSTADVHLGAWLARLVELSGGDPIGDDGKTAMERLWAHVCGGEGAGAVILGKLGQFWEAIRVRDSWRNVYL